MNWCQFDDSVVDYDNIGGGDDDGSGGGNDGNGGEEDGGGGEDGDVETVKERTTNSC